MYLLDLGAAASVIPMTTFSEVCMSMKLAPSEAKLRGASGHGMRAEGEGQLEFMLPGTSKGTKHELQVTADEAMPGGLRILGIVFWHGLNSNVDMASKTVTGTTLDGEHFKLKFHVMKGESDNINSIMAEQQAEPSPTSTSSDKHSMVLSDTIEVHPGRVQQIKMAMLDSLAINIAASKWSWWNSPEQFVLWEPAEYQITTSDDADYRSKNHGMTSIIPTGTSILDMEQADGECTIKQYVFLPDEVT
jgi:hypothetical protein